MASSTTRDSTSPTPIDPADLRADVQAKYREVALHPDARFHFHTGRELARRCR